MFSKKVDLILFVYAFTMLCQKIPNIAIAIDDEPLSMTEWEKTEKPYDFSSIYERKAHSEVTDATEAGKRDLAGCPCTRLEDKRCSVHKEFFPSLEAINEEEAEGENAVKELDMKYDLSLSHRHYSTAKNKGYLQHHKGRHFRKKAFSKQDIDFPRRSRSVTF